MSFSVSPKIKTTGHSEIYSYDTELFILTDFSPVWMLNLVSFVSVTPTIAQNLNIAVKYSYSNEVVSQTYR